MSNRFNSIEAAVLGWLEEGHDRADILAQVKAEYPQISADELLVVEKLLGIGTTEPLVGLLQLQRQRQKLLDNLETKILAEQAPVSLLNLYRGVLRDQEASLWKLLAQQPKQHSTQPGSAQSVQPITEKPVEVRPVLEQPRKRTGGCTFSCLLLLVITFSALYFASLKLTQLISIRATAPLVQVDDTTQHAHFPTLSLTLNSSFQRCLPSRLTHQSSSVPMLVTLVSSRTGTEPVAGAPFLAGSALSCISMGLSSWMVSSH